MTGRISGLGAAQELLIPDEVQGVVIGDIVEKVLRPFKDHDGAIFSTSGPPIRLSSETTYALAMALHELATDAIRYRALSVPEGPRGNRWSIRIGDG